MRHFGSNFMQRDSWDPVSIRKRPAVGRDNGRFIQFAFRKLFETAAASEKFPLLSGLWTTTSNLASSRRGIVTCKACTGSGSS